MSSRPLIVLGLISALTIGVTICVAMGQDRDGNWPARRPSSHASRTRAQNVERVLDAPYDANFSDESLQAIIKKIGNETGIAVSFDQQSMSEEGISLDTTATLQLRGVSLRNVLRRILKPLLLASVIEGNTLKITTSVLVEKNLYLRHYYVQDLIASDSERANEPDVQALIIAIRLATPAAWDNWDGESGKIIREPDGDSLLIRQTQSVHREITGLLSAIRKARRDNRSRDPLPVSATTRNE